VGIEGREASTEIAGIAPRQGVGDGVQDAAELDRVGAACGDAAAVCRIEEAVVGVEEEAPPGVQGFAGGSWP